MKATVVSIILKWKKFGTSKNWLSGQTGNQGRRALVREVTRKLMVTLVGLQR